jgi:hypothetical protein
MVNFATADGTATAGSDYTATSGMLTFGVGEFHKSFNVSILNNSTREPTEYLFTQLSTVAGGGVATLGRRRIGLLTITDND